MSAHPRPGIDILTVEHIRKFLQQCWAKLFLILNCLEPLPHKMSLVPIFIRSQRAFEFRPCAKYHRRQRWKRLEVGLDVSLKFELCSYDPLFLCYSVLWYHAVCWSCCQPTHLRHATDLTWDFLRMDRRDFLIFSMKTWLHAFPNVCASTLRCSPYFDVIISSANCKPFCFSKRGGRSFLFELVE